MLALFKNKKNDCTFSNFSFLPPFPSFCCVSLGIFSSFSALFPVCNTFCISALLTFSDLFFHLSLLFKKALFPVCLPLQFNTFPIRFLSSFLISTPFIHSSLPSHLQILSSLDPSLPLFLTKILFLLILLPH